MPDKNQKIPTEAGKHHTWGTAEPKKYRGKHRPVQPVEDKDEKK